MPYSAITHDSRHPFETYTLFAGFVVGVAAVFGGIWPTSIEGAFDPWVQACWGVILGAGSAGALIGIAVKRRDVGVFMEQIGLAMFGASCFVYGIALLWYNGLTGFPVATFLLMLAFASYRQWRRLENAIKRLITLGQARRRIERGE